VLRRGWLPDPQPISETSNRVQPYAGIVSTDVLQVELITLNVEPLWSTVDARAGKPAQPAPLGIYAESLQISAFACP
jgi:hypothetical protein